MDSEILYFTEVDEVREIEVVVLHDDGRLPVSGRVVDVFVDGVGVRLPKSTSLALGLEVELGLSLPNEPAARPVTLSAQVRTRREAPTNRFYGFRFTRPEELDDKLPRGLYSIFNRRSAERFTLTVPLNITASPIDECRPVLAKVNGASQTGCSLLVDQTSEQVLAHADVIKLSIDQPLLRVVRKGTPVPVPDYTTLDAIVHNRLLLPDGNVRYGCEFDPEDGGADEDRSRFVEFLLNRERKLRAG